MDAIADAAQAVSGSAGLEPEDAHFFSLGLREAVVNAIVHGNRRQRARRVRIRLATEDRRRLIFTVRDEGPGFDVDAVPDPRAPQNLERGSGRGIFYMRKFSDRVTFDFPAEGGTVVRLEKRLPSSRPPRG